MVNTDSYKEIITYLNSKKVTLVAVSKTKPKEQIVELYNLGQRDFGENYVQELVDKYSELPKDIHWHFIGHLQTNKVKDIAPFVYMIHAVDSFKLLTEINKYAQKNKRTISILLQMCIADEETKFGLDEKEIIVLLEYYEAQKNTLENIKICGLMGMATNTDDTEKIKTEFNRLHQFFLHLADTTFFAKPYFSICSIGMSSDYLLAIEQGSNLVRIGSLLFGAREYKNIAGK